MKKNVRFITANSIYIYYSVTEVFTMWYINKFLTIPGEKLILIKRGHWFILAPPTLAVLVVLALLVLTLFTGFIFLPVYRSLVILFFFLTITLALSYLVQVLVRWYYHIYIVTTHKIVEITYAPLSSHLINEVLLNQVRCTEVDVKADGIINELFDKGDVIITFDRPTHQEEFIFSNIQRPSKTALLLSNSLLSIKREEGMPIWVATKENPKKFRFTDDFIPNIKMYPT